MNGTEHPAIEVQHLRKMYGTTVAIDDVAFSTGPLRGSAGRYASTEQ